MYRALQLLLLASTIFSFGFSADFAKPLSRDGTSGEVVRLEKLTVEGEGDTQPVLPTTLNAASLFGPARNALETPRALDVLSSDLLRDAGIRGLGDLVRVSPNTDTPDTFGVPSLPRIRGQEGEIFQNGLRREGGNNGFGLPISFNAFDRIDVVKGPATPVLGPTQRVGGYIDLHTKEPDLSRTRGELVAEAGSFQFYRGLLDYSSPIDAGRSAVRVSWEHVDADSFYDFVVTRTDSVFLAYANKLTDTVRLDLNAEYFDARYSDNAGWNRPTQDLIDHGNYITGTGVSPVTGSISGPAAVIRPTGVVKLARSRVLTDPNDFSTAETFVAQAKLEIKIAPDTTLTNRTSFQTLKKNEVNQNSFVEIVDEDLTLENRTEFAGRFDSDAGGRKFANAFVSGLDLRYHHVVGYSQFNTEADAPIDLTAPIATRRVPNSTVLQLNPGLPQLRPGVYVSPGFSYGGRFATSDTNETDHFQAGLFHQHDFRFNETWSALLGARLDHHQVEVRDPIPPPGFVAASASIHRMQGAANGSLVFAPTQKSSYYATYSFSQSTSNALGGGFTLDGNGQIPKERFETESRLLELGAKFSLLSDTLFISTAAYRQSRNLRNRDGSNSRLNVKGLEAEATYRPVKNLYGLVGISLTDARYDHQVVYQGTGSVNDAFDNSRPDLIAGTSRGSPNFAAFPAADYRFPGLPRVSINTFANYNFDSGFGGNLGVVWASKQNLDVLGRVVIPSQFTVNAGIFYRQPRYEFRLDVLNVTDEKNFATIFNGYFGADLVLPLEPARFRFSASYRF